MNAEKLSKMTSDKWNKFVESVRDREEADDHLNDEERAIVLNEWLNRNESDKKELKHELHEDFCNLVLF